MPTADQNVSARRVQFLAACKSPLEPQERRCSHVCAAAAAAAAAAATAAADDDDDEDDGDGDDDGNPLSPLPSPDSPSSGTWRPINLRVDNDRSIA